MGYPYSHEKEVPILSKYFGDPEARTLKGWKARGGYEALKKALGLSPEDVVEIVKATGLRGRGGAGGRRLRDGLRRSKLLIKHIVY